MLSIEETREILAEEAKDMSEDKIREVRGNIYELVELILNQYLYEEEHI